MGSMRRPDNLTGQKTAFLHAIRYDNDGDETENRLDNGNKKEVGKGCQKREQ